MTKTVFPNGFLWGAATAAHQVEGSNLNSDSWVEEHVKESPYMEPSGDGVDHYHRYREDIKLLKNLGLNSYRFTIEWGRIEPEEGYFSIGAIDHYRDVLKVCLENKLTPIVTMHHFTSPRWLMKYGGWACEKTPYFFARYCEKVMSVLGDLIPYVCTINELNLPVSIQGLISNAGITPPIGIEKSLWETPVWKQEAARVFGIEGKDYTSFFMASSPEQVEILKEAHQRGRAAIRKTSPCTKVGVTFALPSVQGIPGGEEVAKRVWHTYFRQFLQLIERDDFFGLQNYTREQYGADGRINPPKDALLTQMGYENDPTALANVVREVAKDISIPIIITEHGIATSNDKERLDFIQKGLKGLTDCIQEGIDVRGYIYWSMFDNFEWMMGYEKTFGIIAVDRATMRRNTKESGYFYGAIASTNGVGVYNK